MTNKSMQQGDVFLERIDKLPQGKKIDPTERGYTLAEGEATGHAHRIVDDIDQVVMVEADGSLYIKSKVAVPLRHEEHHIIIIEPDQPYRIRQVRERDHLARQTRQVID